MTNDPYTYSLIGALVVATIARSARKSLRRRSTTRTLVADLTAQLDSQSVALEQLGAGMESQLSQLAEMQERLDMTERLLVEYRDRGAGKGLSAATR